MQYHISPRKSSSEAYYETRSISADPVARRPYSILPELHVLLCHELTFGLQEISRYAQRDESDHTNMLHLNRIQCITIK